jgi:uncharacterized protein (DUF2342 family)
MESPEMQQAIRDLAKSVTEGAAQGLSDVQFADRTAQLSSGISSIAAQATSSAVAAALAQAASPAEEKRLQQIAGSAADVAVRSATRALAEEIPSTLAPALAEAMRKNIGPSVRETLAGPELRLVLAQTTYQMARQAVLGSNEALAELEQKKNKVGTLARISGWLANGGWILLIAVVAVAGLVTLAATLLRSRHMHHRA